MLQRKEDDELVAFFDWIRIHANQYPLLNLIFHVANERKTSKFSGARLKRKGVKKGILDVFCPIPRGEYHGLVLEFKIGSNKLTPEQAFHAEMLHGQGFCVRVPRSASEAINTLKEYLGTSFFQ